MSQRCMYTLCTVPGDSSVYTCYVQIWKIMNMYIHVHTMLPIYVHVCTWYVQCIYKVRYKHVCTSFRHVCTRLYVYVLILNSMNMYVQCTNLYIECCVAHVECTDRYIHFMKCTDIVEPSTYIAEPGSYRMQLFYSPVLLACRLGLPAAWCHA